MGEGGLVEFVHQLTLYKDKLFVSFSELDSFLKWTNNSVIHIKKKKNY